MDSKRSASAAFFLSLNLLFCALVSGCNTCIQPPPTQNPNPNPNPNPTPNPSQQRCPIDALKLGVCADLLNGLVGVVIGNPPGGAQCCPLLQGLVDLEVAVCLCIAIRANVLGINLNIPIALSLLVNTCGNNLPSGFQCA